MLKNIFFLMVCVWLFSIGSGDDQPLGRLRSDESVHGIPLFLKGSESFGRREPRLLLFSALFQLSHEVNLQAMHGCHPTLTNQ